MTRTLLASLLVGATVLPYATLWLSRSGRVRARAVRFARTGWHRWVGVGAAALALYTLGASGGGSPLPTLPVELAWAAVTLALAAYAYVEVLAAAEAMRSYPDDGALHYDLSQPLTWPTTSTRIVSVWGWLLAEHHPWLAPAFLGTSLGFALGAVLVPWVGWLALAADCLVLGVCSLPWPAFDREATQTLRRALPTSTS